MSKKEKAPKSVKPRQKTPRAVHMANIYRYFYLPILIFVGLFWKSQQLLVIGTGFVAFSIYSLVGVRLRWEHIYLAMQEMQKQRMTPGKVNWNTIRLSTALKFPLAFGILGSMMVIYQLFYL